MSKKIFENPVRISLIVEEVTKDAVEKAAGHRSMIGWVNEAIIEKLKKDKKHLAQRCTQ